MRSTARMMQALPLDHAAELLGVSRRRVYEGRLRTIRARYGSQRVLVESIEAVLWLKAEQLRVRRAGGGGHWRRWHVPALSWLVVLIG